MSMSEEEGLPFGKWLKDSRNEIGLTQKEFAEKTGVSLGTIQTIEAGTARAIGDLVSTKIQNSISGGTLESPIFNFHQEKRPSLQLFPPRPQKHIIQYEAPPPSDLVKIAKIVMHSDFYERVEKTMDALGVDNVRAAKIVIETLLAEDTRS